MDKNKIKIDIVNIIDQHPLRGDIQKIALFGSYLGKPREDSDVDLLIEFKPAAKVGFFELSRLQRNLTEMLNRQVDLVTPEALSKFFRAEVLANAEIIYEGQ